MFKQLLDPWVRTTVHRLPQSGRVQWHFSRPLWLVWTAIINLSSNYFPVMSLMMVNWALMLFLHKPGKKMYTCSASDSGVRVAARLIVCFLLRCNFTLHPSSLSWSCRCISFTLNPPAGNLLSKQASSLPPRHAPLIATKGESRPGIRAGTLVELWTWATVESSHLAALERLARGRFGWAEPLRLKASFARVIIGLLRLIEKQTITQRESMFGCCPKPVKTNQFGDNLKKKRKKNTKPQTELKHWGIKW